MKSFLQFSESIEDRRRIEMERRRSQREAQNARVSDYQETQAAKRAQRQNEIESEKRERLAAQRIAELERKQQQLQQQLQQQQTEELQLEQIPDTEKTADNLAISKRQRSDKATLRRLTLAAKRSALKSYTQHHLDLLGKIMSH